MATFFLVRHAKTDWVGQGLAGRSDAPLSAEGAAQAARLTDRLAWIEPELILSSPRRRCLETAGPVAAVTGLPVVPEPDLDEVDFGEWTGMSFDELGHDERWMRWNAFRSGTRCPGGESMAEAQARAVGLCHRLSCERAGTRILLFSHSDIIRSALCFWLGMPLDLILRLEIAPASTSTVELGPWGPRVHCVNESLEPDSR